MQTKKKWRGWKRGHFWISQGESDTPARNPKVATFQIPVRSSANEEKETAGMNYLAIEKVIGREILDSRGNPTVEYSQRLLASFF